MNEWMSEGKDAKWEEGNYVLSFQAVREVNISRAIFYFYFYFYENI